MKELISPSFLILSSIYGMISGYLAYRRKKNPLKWFFIGFLFGLVGIAFFLIPLKQKKVSTLQKTIMILNGPQDKLWFYLDANHQQVGPMSYNAISKEFSQKTITEETYVWHENLDKWKPLSTLIIPRESYTNSSK